MFKSLLIANTAVFGLMLFLGLFTLDGYPVSRFIGEVFPLYPLGQGFQVWQLVTYLFMHGSFMHLLFNMFALWMFGLELENEWGSKKFLAYYALCGFGAALANLFIAPLFAPAAPTVGASGAIYGVLLAFGMMYPDRPIFVRRNLVPRDRRRPIDRRARYARPGHRANARRHVGSWCKLGYQALDLTRALVPRTLDPTRSSRTAPGNLASRSRTWPPLRQVSRASWPRL